MTHHTPHPNHCHEVSPLTPKGPLLLPMSGARCTACPRSWRVGQPGAIIIKGPVNTLHQTLRKEPLSPYQDSPIW
ncbi:hypothetical protein E2C01_102207 [Portunus trituberculatus]|uniref:Uncharacterized protein n=1 Tax=Portunus trituberculatus TaxID=210409 RepID=A0A5B7KHU7_PORTR|nr:hypothetical protein [Portunus trituberculatus]